jgi:hypothetical protein
MTHRAPLSAHLVALAALLTACSTGSDPGVTETSGVDPSGPTSATPTSGLTLTTVRSHRRHRDHHHRRR